MLLAPVVVAWLTGDGKPPADVTWSVATDPSSALAAFEVAVEARGGRVDWLPEGTEARLVRDREEQLLRLGTDSWTSTAPPLDGRWLELSAIWDGARRIAGERRQGVEVVYAEAPKGVARRVREGLLARGFHVDHTGNGVVGVRGPNGVVRVEVAWVAQGDVTRTLWSWTGPVMGWERRLPAAWLNANARADEDGGQTAISGCDVGPPFGLGGRAALLRLGWREIPGVQGWEATHGFGPPFLMVEGHGTALSFTASGPYVDECEVAWERWLPVWADLPRPAGLAIGKMYDDRMQFESKEPPEKVLAAWTATLVGAGFAPESQKEWARTLVHPDGRRFELVAFEEAGGSQGSANLLTKAKPAWPVNPTASLPERVDALDGGGWAVASIDAAARITVAGQATAVRVVVTPTGITLNAAERWTPAPAPPAGTVPSVFAGVPGDAEPARVNWNRAPAADLAEYGWVAAEAVRTGSASETRRWKKGAIEAWMRLSDDGSGVVEWEVPSRPSPAPPDPPAPTQVADPAAFGAAPSTGAAPIPLAAADAWAAPLRAAGFVESARTSWGIWRRAGNLELRLNVGDNRANSTRSGPLGRPPLTTEQAIAATGCEPVLATSIDALLDCHGTDALRTGIGANPRVSFRPLPDLDLADLAPIAALAGEVDVRPAYGGRLVTELPITDRPGAVAVADVRASMEGAGWRVVGAWAEQGPVTWWRGGAIREIELGRASDTWLVVTAGDRVPVPLWEGFVAPAGVAVLAVARASMVLGPASASDVHRALAAAGWVDDGGWRRDGYELGAVTTDGGWVLHARPAVDGMSVAWPGGAAFTRVYDRMWGNVEWLFATPVPSAWLAASNAALLADGWALKRSGRQDGALELRYARADGLLAISADGQELWWKWIPASAWARELRALLGGEYAEFEAEKTGERVTLRVEDPGDLAARLAAAGWKVERARSTDGSGTYVREDRAISVRRQPRQVIVEQVPRGSAR